MCIPKGCIQVMWCCNILNTSSHPARSYERSKKQTASKSRYQRNVKQLAWKSKKASIAQTYSLMNRLWYSHLILFLSHYPKVAQHHASTKKMHLRMGRSKQASTKWNRESFFLGSQSESFLKKKNSRWLLASLVLGEGLVWHQRIWRLSAAKDS